MYRVIWLALLAGCASAPSKVDGFRKPGAPIYSNAVLDADRLQGDWVQVAQFASADAPACEMGALRIGPGQAAQGQVCLNGALVPVAGPLRPTGPGRFAPPTGEAWWVLWADTNYRTLAIGTPSGRFGFILNRGADLPPDRMAAARAVFDWNGYALARLR
jgi:apolipoprotein D and lipocalin family protein